MDTWSCSVTQLGKAKIVNVIQHTVHQYTGPLCASISSINHAHCSLYVAFDKCFYICDVVVVKSFYIAFLVHKEQFAFQLHASWITVELDFWGTLGRCMGCSLVKSVSFRVLRYKADRIYKNASMLLVTEREKSNHFMLVVFSGP